MNEIAVLPEKLKEEIAKSGINDMTLVERISSAYAPFFGEVQEQIELLKPLKMGDEDDAKKAKRIALDLGKIRSSKKDVKKDQKDYYLKVTRFIDSLDGTVEGMISLTQEEAKKHADYFDNLERERKEKLGNDRWEMLSEFTDLRPPGLEIHSDEIFNIILKGAKQDKIERKEAEKAEQDRLAEEKRKEELRAKRNAEIIPFYAFFEVPAIQTLAELSEEEYQQKVAEAKKSMADKKAEDEKIRLENERLKKEQEAKDKAQAEKEQKQKEEADKNQAERVRRIDLMGPFIQFIRNYEGLLSSKNFENEFAEIKKGAEDHWELERKEQIKKQKQEEKEAKEIAEKQTELNRLKAKEEEDRLAKIAEEQRLAELSTAGDKAILQDWITKMNLPDIDTTKMSEQSKDVANNIFNKFNLFKVWANNEIDKL